MNERPQDVLLHIVVGQHHQVNHEDQGVAVAHGPLTARGPQRRVGGQVQQDVQHLGSAVPPRLARRPRKRQWAAHNDHLRFLGCAAYRLGQLVRALGEQVVQQRVAFAVGKIAGEADGALSMSGSRPAWRAPDLGKKKDAPEVAGQTQEPDEHGEDVEP